MPMVYQSPAQSYLFLPYKDTILSERDTFYPNFWWNHRVVTEYLYNTLPALNVGIITWWWRKHHRMKSKRTSMMFLRFWWFIVNSIWESYSNLVHRWEISDPHPTKWRPLSSTPCLIRGAFLQTDLAIRVFMTNNSYESTPLDNILFDTKHQHNFVGLLLC